jgi:predicted DCC family thiol-disulfide oxidoreductase YuxK
LLAWDRRGALRPVPISSEEGGRLLADMPEEQRLASWHLVRDGRRRSAGAAFPPLLSLLPGGSLPARLSARLPRLSEAGYGFVARNRGFFSRLVSDGARRRADRRIRLRSG